MHSVSALCKKTEGRHDGRAEWSHVEPVEFRAIGFRPIKSSSVRARIRSGFAVFFDEFKKSIDNGIP